MVSPVISTVAKDKLPVTIVDKSYRGVTVDTRYTPIKNILQYVEGSRYKVRYYRQALGTDNEVQAQDADLAPAHQQYIVIDQMLLAVTQELDPVQNETDGQFVVTGQAIVFPGLIPNKGDMFLGDIGDGEEGIFTIRAAPRALTHLRDTYYEIEYVLTDRSTGMSRKRADLDAKVIQELVFVQDYLAVGEKPIITKTEFLTRQEMILTRRELIDMYYADFYSRNRNTLLVPDQAGQTYDPFVTSFMRDMITARENQLADRVDMPSVMQLPGMRQYLIWDALRKSSASMIRTVGSRVGLICTRYFRNQAHYAGVYYAGLEYVAYPLDRRADVDTPFDKCAPSESGAILSGDVRRGDLSEFLSQDLEGFNYTRKSTDAIPYFVPVTFDNRYVFTEKFYACGGAFSSQLERQVFYMLDQKPLDKALILAMGQATNALPNLERFYYVPMMLALLNAAIRTN